MLRIDLSILNRAELLRLRDQAQARGQAGLADQVQAELDARAAGGAAPRPLAQPADEGDDVAPMRAPDEPFAGADDLRLDGVGRPAPRRRRPLAFGLAAVAAAFGVAFGWGFLGAPGLPRPAPPEPAPAAAPASPRVAVTPAPATPRAAVARLDPPVAPEPQAAPPPAQPEHRPPKPAPEPPPPALKARSADTAADDAVSRPRRVDPCANPPTPADRLLCHDLALNLLERELRDAYGRALDAGVDPVALRADQAAWRAERDPVSDPRTLARLYDRRIRDLRAQAVGPGHDRQSN